MVWRTGGSLWPHIVGWPTPPTGWTPDRGPWVQRYTDGLQAESPDLTREFALRQAEQEQGKETTSVTKKESTSKVTTQETFTVQMIPSFLKQHPKVTIELINSPKPRNILAEGIDIAIYAEPSKQHHAEEIVLGQLYYGIYASDTAIATYAVNNAVFNTDN